MLFISLGHKARHGKDTFAQAVYDAYGHNLDIRRHSFAEPLRAEVRQAASELWAKRNPLSVFHPQQALRMLCETCGVEFEENAPVDEDYPWGKQRKLHQWWGTEYRRAQDQDYWVKQARNLYRTVKSEGADAFFFRDLRFDNEYNLTGEEGGWRVKISRLGYVSDVPQHISETELDNHAFDLHVGVKDGELDLLKDLSVLTFKRLARL